MLLEKLQGWFLVVLKPVGPAKHLLLNFYQCANQRKMCSSVAFLSSAFITYCCLFHIREKITKNDLTYWNNGIGTLVLVFRMVILIILLNICIDLYNSKSP